MHIIKAKQILTSHGGNGTNVYRGCQHGCIYCDARSKCYNFDHDFEDIAVKDNAPELLDDTLSRKRQRCMIGSGSMCDPYMPLESDVQITRRCLEVIKKHHFGATVITKSDLVLRDIDLFTEINKRAKAVLQMTLTTADESLCRIIEPNVCTTSRRFEVLCTFRDAGIPTVVWFSPLLPFINDTIENIDAIVDYCIRAGVKGIICFGIGVTLRAGNREYFYQQLDKSFPGLRHKYEATFRDAYSVTRDKDGSLYNHLRERCRQNNIMCNPNEVFAYLSQMNDTQHRAKPVQLELF